MNLPTPLALLAALTPLIANAQENDALRAKSAELNGATGNALQTDDAITVGGYTKIRYNINARDEVPNGEDSAIGFSNADTSLIVDGTVNRFGFHVWTMFPPDGDFVLHKAFVSLI